MVSKLTKYLRGKGSHLFAVKKILRRLKLENDKGRKDVVIERCLRYINSKKVKFYGVRSKNKAEGKTTG